MESKAQSSDPQHLQCTQVREIPLFWPLPLSLAIWQPALMTFGGRVREDLPLLPLHPLVWCQLGSQSLGRLQLRRFILLSVLGIPHGAHAWGEDIITPLPHTQKPGLWAISWELGGEGGPPVAWRAWKRPLFSSAAPTAGSCLTMAMEEAGQDVINPFYAAALA